MISKLAKAKNNWFFKIISIAVAVSFISLFGVTGYISSASQNQTIVNVGGLKTSQSEFSYRLQKELNALKNLSGDDFEISDELRNTLADGVIQQIIGESVIDQTMNKYNIYFPKAFVQQIIFSRPEFINPLNGQFHPELFKRYLSSTGMTEAQYVASIKRLMAQKILVSDMVQTFAIPQVLSNAIHKMDNQRRTFKYVKISPKDIKIERQITDDEIRQYYDDFSENFMLPETRDVEVLFIPSDVILNKYAASSEMVEDYFNQHKKELDQPEKREVAQMVFTDKETAEKAFALVQSGKKFADVAKELKAENANNPTLGEVAEDELAEDLSGNVFSMNINEPKLLQVADSWQVVNVTKVIAAKEATFEEAKTEIVESLKNENLYEALRNARADIDDATNEGKTLAEIGATFNVKPVIVTDIEEEQVAENAPLGLKTLDFNELVFNYSLDEFSSAEEFDDGIAVIQVKKIVDSHLPEIDSIKEKIVELWTVQEKNALAKETAENIMNDTEDGSDFGVAAKARKLEVLRSAPISRNEAFAGLSKFEINELFLAEDGTTKLFEKGGNAYIIATPVETINYKDELTDEKLTDIKKRAEALISSDMKKAALDRYAEDYKVKVDYDLAGFSE